MVIQYWFLISVILCSITPSVLAEEKKSVSTLQASNMVRVYIATTGEERSIELKHSQLATVKVYLASLGDMVDKFMISLLDLKTNKIVASQLSDVDGIAIFRKIPPGSYNAYVNTRVKEDGEIYNVKVADVVLSKF